MSEVFRAFGQMSNEPEDIIADRHDRHAFNQPLHLKLHGRAMLKRGKQLCVLVFDPDFHPCAQQFGKLCRPVR